MNAHFTSFTPEAMRAFGQALTADTQRRVEFVNHTRRQTLAMLANARKHQREAAAKRRLAAEREADARRLHTSELRSSVHALLGRFELGRKETAQGLHEMAGEFRTACDAFRARFGHRGDTFMRRGFAASHFTDPSEVGGDDTFRADTDTQEGKARFTKSRKRQG